MLRTQTIFQKHQAEQGEWTREKQEINSKMEQLRKDIQKKGDANDIEMLKRTSGELSGEVLRLKEVEYYII